MCSTVSVYCTHALYITVFFATYALVYSLAVCLYVPSPTLTQQEAQLSQKDRAMLRVTVIKYFAVTQGHSKWHHSMDRI